MTEKETNSARHPRTQMPILYQKYSTAWSDYKLFVIVPFTLLISITTAYPQQFPKLSEETMLQRLKHPQKEIKAVIDTDTYNEIDDQFAVVYALLSPEQMEVEAIYAAPYFNSRSTGAADGMEKSHEEILRP